MSRFPGTQSPSPDAEGVGEPVSLAQERRSRAHRPRYEDYADVRAEALKRARTLLRGKPVMAHQIEAAVDAALEVAREVFQDELHYGGASRIELQQRFDPEYAFDPEQANAEIREGLAHAKENDPGRIGTEPQHQPIHRV